MSRVGTFFSVISLMITVLLVGCSLFQQPEQTTQPIPKEVQITARGGACGSAVGLDTGDTLVVIMDDYDLIQDYIWEVGYYVPEVIKPGDESEYQSNSDSGTGNTSTFRFLAVGEGIANLRLIYHNPAEIGAPETKICDVTVRVDKPELHQLSTKFLQRVGDKS